MVTNEVHPLIFFDSLSKIGELQVYGMSLDIIKKTWGSYTLLPDWSKIYYRKRTGILKWLKGMLSYNWLNLPYWQTPIIISCLCQKTYHKILLGR